MRTASGKQLPRQTTEQLLKKRWAKSTLDLKAQAWMTGTDRETFASLASQAQILAVNRGTISA